VMTEEQRKALRAQLRGGAAEPTIPFSEPGNLTRVYAVTSGKGGVGKSSVTANLAAAMAADGLKVGVVDADIYGFSIPRMLGVEHPPTKVDDMILPPVAGDVKVISIGMFAPPGRPIVWRGPMLHRALQQFLADVFWGDLDVLLLDLPPGTGDIAISVGQLLPGAELLVVTTPQTAAAEVAERAGSLAGQTNQHVVGVIENMSWLEQPDGSRVELFGSGGGRQVADNLSAGLGYDVPLLGQVPLEIKLREGGDSGRPFVEHDDSAAAEVLRGIARTLSRRARGLAARSLGISPRSPHAGSAGGRRRPTGSPGPGERRRAARRGLPRQWAGGSGGLVVEGRAARGRAPPRRRTVGAVVVAQRVADDPPGVVLPGVERAEVEVVELRPELRAHPFGGVGRQAAQVAHQRSEEHTSELQSRENLVC